MSQHPTDPSTPPSASVPPITPGAVPGEATATPDEIEKGKTLAILGYIIWIVAIVVLVQKDNKFSLYHAKQELVHLIFAVCCSIVGSALIPVFGIGCVVLPVVAIANVVLIVMGVINAVNGRMVPLPIIGKFADKWFAGMQVKQA